jgi:FeS assembly SUF system protein
MDKSPFQYPLSVLIGLDTRDSYLEQLAIQALIVWLIRVGVIQALKQVYDPEIPINIYDLGLIYTIQIDKEGRVLIHMTLTAPGCPFAQTLPEIVQNAVNHAPGVIESSVELVWDPPWTQEQMSEAARLQLGLI